MQRCRVRDYYEMPPSREIDPRTGFLRAPAKIARTGVQVYSARDLGLDGGDKPVRLYRPLEEVSKSARTFESVPMTDEHPPMDVTAENWRQLAAGDVRDVTMEGEFLCACVIVKDADTIDVVRDGKAELSCGYSFSLDMTSGTTAAGEQYDGIQRDIEGNHVAIVDRGRAGPRVRIADRRGTIMTKHRIVVADKKLTEKVTIPGFEIDLELDEVAAKTVRDKFDLHAHGIGAAKDAYDQLSTAHKSLQDNFAELKDSLEAMGEEDDDLMEEDDKAFAGEETPEEEAEEKKAVGDAKRYFKGKDGKRQLTLRARLRRAIDAYKALKASSTQEAIEKVAEERSKVIDAARPVLGEEFDAKGKTVHQIRIAAIDTAIKDETLGEIAKIQVGDSKVEKLTVAAARRAFDTIVKLAGKTSAADDGQDENISRALLGGAGNEDVRQTYDPVRAYYARDAARSRRSASGVISDGDDSDGASVEDR
jgi:hypothetical protein